MRTKWIAFAAYLVITLPFACETVETRGGGGGEGGGGHGGAYATSGGGSTVESTSSTSSAGGGEGGSGGEGGQGGGGTTVARGCGDGVLDQGEDCDDGNVDTDDGCTACDVDPGFSCDGAPSHCAPAGGQVVTAGRGLDLLIPDDAYDGTLESMVCAELSAPVSMPITSVLVNLRIEHNYLGDLVIKLVSPGGTVVTLMSRAGAVELADDVSDNVFADDSDLLPTARILFDTTAPTSAEDMGKRLPDNAYVCLADGICTFSPDPGAAAPGDLSTLAGEDARGTWRLCIGDAAPLDAGYLDLATIIIP